MIYSVLIKRKFPLSLFNMVEMHIHTVKLWSVYFYIVTLIRIYTYCSYSLQILIFELRSAYVITVKMNCQSIFPIHKLSTMICIVTYFWSWTTHWHILIMSSMSIYLGREHYKSAYSSHYLHIYAPAYSKNSGRALSVTPVRPVRTSVRTPVPIRVRAITPKPYGIYLWNFTGACMTLWRCVMNKEDNSCFFGFLIICPWLSSR